MFLSDQTAKLTFKGKELELSEILPEHAVLKEKRSKLGMTQQEVADLAQISIIRQYQKFESGERKLSASSFKTAMRVCNALGLDPFELA